MLFFRRIRRNYLFCEGKFVSGRFRLVSDERIAFYLVFAFSNQIRKINENFATLKKCGRIWWVSRHKDEARRPGHVLTWDIFMKARVFPKVDDIFVSTVNRVPMLFAKTTRNGVLRAQILSEQWRYSKTKNSDRYFVLRYLYH